MTQRQCQDAFSCVMTVWTCVAVVATWYAEAANLQKNAASYVQKFVMRVQKNVKNTVMRTIVKNVQMHADRVQKNVVVWHNFFWM